MDRETQEKQEQDSNRKWDKHNKDKYDKQYKSRSPHDQRYKSSKHSNPELHPSSKVRKRKHKEASHSESFSSEDEQEHHHRSKKQHKPNELENDEIKTRSVRERSTKGDKPDHKSKHNDSAVSESTKDSETFEAFEHQTKELKLDRGKGGQELKRAQVPIKHYLNPKIDNYIRSNPLAKKALMGFSEDNLNKTTKNDFVFFFGKDSPFSQFHPVYFSVDNKQYNCAEQFMMHQKAVTFNDKNHAERIMAETKPLLMKRLGRKVHAFDPNVWSTKSIEVVKRGNIEKFKQNPHIEKQLIDTHPKILAEASPRDCLWGIGRGARSPEALSIASWRGKNLLGFTLMEVRQILMKSKGMLKK